MFVPLTMLCRDRCGYCTFAKPPARLDAPVPRRPEEVLAIARRGAELGCHEALFTLGEASGGAVSRGGARGSQRPGTPRRSTTSRHVAAPRARGDRPAPPRQRRCALPQPELERLRTVSPSQGMMIETLAARLGDDGRPARTARPTRHPERRLATLEAAGRARIPFTTGILVGIGETRAERIEALDAIADVAPPPRPRAGSDRAELPAEARHRDAQGVAACPTDEFLWSIAVARLVLPDDVHLQAPPNLSDDLAPLLAAGIDDWGGVSPVTIDHVNPERPWPALDRLRAATEAAGKVLAPRLTIYPEFVRDPEHLARSRTCARAVLVASDSEGLARDTGVVARPRRPDTADAARRRRCASRRGPGVRSAKCCDGVHRGRRGRRRRDRHAARRRAAPRCGAVAEVADQLRREIVGDEVTFVRNRNINYTNVCTFKCRFCAFSKGPLSLNLRGKPYLLELEEMQRRVVEAVECGATEVCLQGGIHPDFDGDYYVEVAKAVKAVAPGIHVHGFTALEVTEGARRLDMPLERVPGAAARPPASRRCPGPRPRSSTTRSARSSAPTR